MTGPIVTLIIYRRRKFTPVEKQLAPPTKTGPTVTGMKS